MPTASSTPATWASCSGNGAPASKLLARVLSATAPLKLERLQTRMVHRHEEERERISRELHDETAQILAAGTYSFADNASSARGFSLDVRWLVLLFC